MQCKVSLFTFGAKFCSKHILEGNTFKELTDLTTKAAHS